MGQCGDLCAFQHDRFLQQEDESEEETRAFEMLTEAIRIMPNGTDNVDRWEGEATFSASRYFWRQ